MFSFLSAIQSRQRSLSQLRIFAPNILILYGMIQFRDISDCRKMQNDMKSVHSSVAWQIVSQFSSLLHFVYINPRWLWGSSTERCNPCSQWYILWTFKESTHLGRPVHIILSVTTPDVLYTLRICYRKRLEIFLGESYRNIVRQNLTPPEEVKIGTCYSVLQYGNNFTRIFGYHITDFHFKGWRFYRTVGAPKLSRAFRKSGRILVGFHVYEKEVSITETTESMCVE